MRIDPGFERGAALETGDQRVSRFGAGWAKVAGSWDAIFRNTAYIQFVLTDEQVVVVGDAAWVTLDENILQSAGTDELSGSKATATNVFVRDDDADGWRMVVHHSSPVAGDG